MEDVLIEFTKTFAFFRHNAFLSSKLRVCGPISLHIYALKAANILQTKI